MNLKLFFERLVSLLFTFPYEWRRISKEVDKEYLWFLGYESLISGVTFFLGALWAFGIDMGVGFLATRALVFSLVLFVYVLFLAKIFGVICNYYNLRIKGQVAERLVVYVSGFYFTSIFAGTLLAPENYFFILFVMSFFSGYYFSGVLLKYFKKNIYAFFAGTVLFLFHLISYFVFINLLATIK